MLSGFLHIEETLTLFTTSNQTNNADAKMGMKLVSANSMMFLVMEKAYKDDELMMTKIWKNGNTWVSRLLKLLLFHDAECSERCPQHIH